MPFAALRAMAEDGLVLRAASGREGLVSWRNLRDPDSDHILLDYGEVLTTNTAQGSTVTEHIHALPAGSHLVSAFGAYTSGSRHRELSFIVTSDGAERAEVAARRPLGDRREVVVQDVLTNIVRNFSRQPIKESSLSLIERARDLRRGSVVGFQVGVAGLAEKGTRQRLSTRFAFRRATTQFERLAPHWVAVLRQRAKAIVASATSLSTIVKRVAIAAAAVKARRERYWSGMKDPASDTSARRPQTLRQQQEPRIKQ